MTNVTYGIFLFAIFLLILAVIFQLPIAAGGGAVVMMVGLIYAFVVTKRDFERSKYVDRRKG